MSAPASVSALSAEGRFFFLLPDSSFLLFPLLSFASLPLSRTAFRNAPGDVFSAKENSFFIGIFGCSQNARKSLWESGYFSMLCLVGFSEKNIKKPEYLPRLVKKSIRDFISLRCLCLDEDSQSCNEALYSLFFPLPGE